MGISEVFLISVGLAADAFAASVCKGLEMKKLRAAHALIIGLFFGGFQALMPLLGWALGRQFESYITEIDHWIAFVLLGIIGGKMVFDSIREMRRDDRAGTEGDEDEDEGQFSLKNILVLAIATSIDALAVGVSFAFLNVNIVSAVAVIGVVTFILSVVGVFLGNKFGAKYQSKAALAGGIILILMGLKILLEHLGIINF